MKYLIILKKKNKKIYKIGLLVEIRQLLVVFIIGIFYASIVAEVSRY